MTHYGNMENEEDEKLDFFEAMRDFRTMFPTLDESVIESVLRSTNGAVDDTIDHLLIMATEMDAYNETLPKRTNELSSSSVLLPSTLNVDPSEMTAQHHLAEFLSGPTVAAAVEKQPSPRSVACSVAIPKKKIYHPPFVGKLPKDFLRLESAAPLTKKYSFQSGPPPYSMATMPIQRAHSVTGAGGSAQSSSKYPHRAYLGIFSTSVPTGSKPISPRRQEKLNDLEFQRQAEILKEKMAENQWRRQVTHDPELGQFLEDERIALMLQNEEFFFHLRNDREFLAALERDAAKQKKKREKAMSKSAKSSTAGPGASQKFEYIESPSREESVMDDGLDPQPSFLPFPYTKTLPSSDEADVAFSEKLKLMGKSSKRKFALMARKFVRKKKGARGILGTSDSHYAGMSLLESTDEAEIERSNVADSGYNQLNDETYNIGGRTDLKEGRLFSS